MIAGNSVTPAQVGRIFAGLVKHDPGVRKIWVRRHRDVFEVWVLTENIGPEHERVLLRAANDLQREFPDSYLDIRLINPRYYELESVEEIEAELLPRDADLIMSR